MVERMTHEHDNGTDLQSAKNSKTTTTETKNHKLDNNHDTLSVDGIDLSLKSEEDLKAQAYYDSDDAYNFYLAVWGGDNIHVGLYDFDLSETAFSDIAQKLCDLNLNSDVVNVAGHKSLETLCSKYPPKEGDTVMDMGSAYGGCARYLASTFDVTVSCVDLSKKENVRNMELTKEANLDHLIYVNGERSFTNTGEQSSTFDRVFSQDSFLHAGQYRAGAIREAARVLKPGGYLIFSDIMQSDEISNPEVLRPVSYIYIYIYEYKYF